MPMKKKKPTQANFLPIKHLYESVFALLKCLRASKHPACHTHPSWDLQQADGAPTVSAWISSSASAVVSSSSVLAWRSWLSRAARAACRAVSWDSRSCRESCSSVSWRFSSSFCSSCSRLTWERETSAQLTLTIKKPRTRPAVQCAS